MRKGQVVHDAKTELMVNEVQITGRRREREPNMTQGFVMSLYTKQETKLDEGQGLHHRGNDASDVCT